MGFWRDAAFTAAGYGIHELMDRKKSQQTMGQVIKDMGVRLRDTIDRMYDK